MTPHFVLLVAARAPSATDERGPSRLGVVATRKVGNSVERSRIKRLCRECFRSWPGFVPDGIDLVVIARQGAQALTLRSVREEWSRARRALLRRCESALKSAAEDAAEGAPAKTEAAEPDRGPQTA